MNFKKAREYIINRLSKDLDKTLYYHSLEHTLEVEKWAEQFGIMENVSEEEVILLKTAALYHDAGFLVKYIANEYIAARMVREILPNFNYKDDEIELISDMILSTKIPQTPITLLDKILCDADLEYIGREDFFMIAFRLNRELNEHGFVMSLKEWYYLQLEFISKHNFFTNAAKTLRQEGKMIHLTQIKELLSVE